LSEFPVTVNDSRQALPVDFEFPPFFSFSTALGSAFKFCKDNALFFHKVVFAFYIPFLLPQYLLKVVGGGGVLSALLPLLHQLTLPIMTGALIYGAIHWYRTGANPQLSDCFKWGVKKWWPIFVASILTAIATGFGFLLLVIPGIIFFTMFSISSQIAAAENVAPLQAMNRSIELTSGYRWRIFGTLFSACLITYVISFAISKTVLAESQPLAADLIAVIVRGLLGGFDTVLALVIYLGIISARNLEASYPSEPALAIAAER